MRGARAAVWFKSVWFRLAVAALVLIEAALWGLNSSFHTPILGIPVGLPIALLTKTSGARHFGTWPAVIVEQGGVLTVFSAHAPEAEEARTHPKPGEEVRAEVWCWPIGRAYGLAAPALISYDHTVHIMSRGNAGFSAQEYASIRHQYVSMVAAEWHRGGNRSSPYPRLLATGDGKSICVRPSWLAHDLIVLGMTGAALMSWYHGSFKPARARRHAAWNVAQIEARRCPSCGYSIAGLSKGADSKCPECGRLLAS